MNKYSGRFLLSVTLLAGAAVCFASAAEGFAPPARAETLTLQQTVQMAIKRAPDVGLAREQEARSREALKETKSSNLPQVVAGTGLAYNNGFPLSIEGAAPSIVQVAVTQSIFSKKNKNLILGAEQGAKTSRLASESVRNDLAARAALVYFELHQDQKLAGLWRLRLQALEKEQQVTADLLESGKVKPLELTLAQAAAEAAKQQVLIAEERRRIAAFELREMTGLAENTEIQTVAPVFDEQLLNESAENLYLKALKGRPDILQSESDVQAKEFGVEAAKGEARPRMDAVGQYALFAKTNNYADYFNRFVRNNYLIGLSVQMPLFDGARNKALVAQSRHEVSEAKYRLQRARSSMRLEIERNVSALLIAKGAAQLARRELSASQENLRVSETLYEAGRISLKEMEASRTQVRERESALIDSESTLFQRKIELARIAGCVSELLGE
jgi:outer membrane protein TolC